MQLTNRATISSGGSCLGFACDGWITLLSNCSASYGSAYSVQPFMYESCVCANSTAFQNYATACYNCYSGLGNSAGASTIASIIQNCRPSASLTSTGVPVTTVPTVAASTSMTSTEAQCGVNGLYVHICSLSVPNASRRLSHFKVVMFPPCKKQKCLLVYCAHSP